VGIWLLFEEHLTGLYLRRLVNQVVPLTRAQSIELRGDSGWIVALVKHASNKNTAAAMILTWPWLLVSATLARRPWQQVLRYGTAAALVTAILLSDHETSKVAIVASVIVFLLATLSRQLAFALVAVAWFAATLVIVPAAMFAYGSGAHLIEAVQYSGRHRLVIWGVTAERALDRPLRGHGLASTRVIDEMTPPEQRRPVPGTNIPQGTNMHSHNVFLQTWHETGMPGALLLFLAGLPVLAWLAARPATTARYLYAGFIAALVLASLSWSLVASWYIATFALAAIWMLIADVVGRGSMPALRPAPNDPSAPADQITPSS
jgi:O-antigen ligase